MISKQKSISLRLCFFLKKKKKKYFLSSPAVATCIVIPLFLKGSLRYLHCSHMYSWKCCLFSIEANHFIHLKCVRVTGGLRKIGFSGKDLEAKTQEGILKARSWEPGEHGFYSAPWTELPPLSGPWTEKLVEPVRGEQKFRGISETRALNSPFPPFSSARS